MNFGTAIVSGFRNSFNFSGRASRSEFWFFTLFSGLVVGGSIAELALLDPAARVWSGLLMFSILVDPITREWFGLVLFFVLVSLLVPGVALSSGGFTTLIEPVGGF